MNGEKFMKDRYVYVAVLTFEEHSIAIEFPDLPGCYPCAEKDDIDGALQNAKEALGLHLWGMEQDGEEIPYPTSITELSLGKDQIPALIDVFMPPVRERINSKFVKKTLSLPAWLAAKADEDGVNCSRLFQNALMEYLGVTGNAKVR
jgi:predicted RNase H-like HicB family nuclease